MTTAAKARPLFDASIVKRALVDALKKLDPRHQLRNPVMFTVWVGSALTTGLGVHALFERPPGVALGGFDIAGPIFIFVISAWLWFTVLFANFAEAMAEGRGKAQADSLRAARRDVVAVKLDGPQHEAGRTQISASQLRKGDIVLVEAGNMIPADGEVIEGV